SCVVCYLTVTALPYTSPLPLHDALPIFTEKNPLPGTARWPGWSADSAEKKSPNPPSRCTTKPTTSVAPMIITIACSESVQATERDRKSTRLNSSHVKISYAVFCLKKKTQ